MLKKREIQRIESKEREWDLAIRDFKRRLFKFWDSFKDKLKIEVKRMLDFIMFYKPSDKLDRKWHIFEMIIIYIFLVYATKGLLGI